MTQGGGGAQVNQQNQSQAQNQGQNGQQQIQLQQNTNTTAIHGTPTQQQQQHAHTAQATHQAMSATQVQVIQQSLQGQYIPQFYNTGQGQLLMNGNILHHPGLNQGGIQPAQVSTNIQGPTIQVITTPGKFQSNQLGGQQMLTTGASYATIPTTQANNQAYYITSTGQLIPSQGSLIQQHGQTSKPGEMPKVIGSQILSGQQHPQLWTSPQLIAPNQIFIQRGGQQDQPMFIQHQPMHTNTSTHQQFSMQQIAAGQLQANMAGGNPGMQQGSQPQQQNGIQTTNVNGQQVQTQIAPQPIQPQSTGNVTIKGPAHLQPKPPQIQPQPTAQQQAMNAAQQQQNLQQQPLSALGQLQQVMTHAGQQLQIIPQPPTSQTGVVGQQIMTSHGQQITLQQAGGLNNPRLALVSQQQQHSVQPQVSVVQHQIPTNGTQPQPIRPNNFTIVTQGTANIPVTQPQVTQPSSANNTQSTGANTASNQKPSKSKKAAAKNNTNASPNAPASNAGNKAVFPKPPQLSSISPMHPQVKSNTVLTPQTVGKQGSSPAQAVSNIAPGSGTPLKTINLAALQSPPNLPDATLTPLNPNTVSVSSPAAVPAGLTYTPVLPSPNISITPAPPPVQPVQIQNQLSTPTKKDESEPVKSAESKGDTEKENNGKITEENDDSMSKQNKLPKAMVKPQVLTHVIEGFVIQEASEPFPMPKNGELDEPPKKKAALSISSTGEVGKCEMCGKVDLKSKFKKNKRFCSSACVKSAKNASSQPQQPTQPSQPPTANGVVEKQKRGRKWADGDSELTDETSSSTGEPTANDYHGDEEPKVDPTKWSVSEVVDFVRALQGCSEYAEDFLVQEIDGQALMLLKAEHLMSGMGMKLGPALKLCAQIENIKAANGCATEAK